MTVDPLTPVDPPCVKVMVPKSCWSQSSTRPLVPGRPETPGLTPQISTPKVLPVEPVEKPPISSLLARGPSIAPSGTKPFPETRGSVVVRPAVTPPLVAELAEAFSR